MISSSEFNYVFIYFGVKLPHVALVQLLSSHNLVDLFLIEIVVLVEVDCHVPHLPVF